jgi:hypothetical protein
MTKRFMFGSSDDSDRPLRELDRIAVNFWSAVRAGYQLGG